MLLALKSLALFSVITTALPVDNPNLTARNGRGATIYTSRNLTGRSTFIPGNAYCTDLNNIFGDFDGQIHSVTAEKGFQCSFFADYACLAAAPHVTLGSIASSQSLAVLPSNLDNAMHSVYCAAI